MAPSPRVLAFAALAAALLVPLAAQQDAAAESGFTNTKKTAGIIMKFCHNETFLLQECKERYGGIGWTDRINVLVYAPGWNEDGDRIEQIGGPSNPITVTTDAARVTNVEFTETGADTGMFMGVVKMTGERGYVVHDTYRTTARVPGATIDADRFGGPGNPLSAHARAVMIATSPQDGQVSVTWEFNEDEFVIRSAEYGWQVGQAEFGKAAYDVNEDVTFFIRDTDLWTHHHAVATNYVRVYSDTDRDGIHVGVKFLTGGGHAKAEKEAEYTHLTTPAASSLTKYTPDGEWKTYLWWEPGGVLGAGQDYDVNLMVHDGLTDMHQMGISYDMEIYLDGELLESRTDRYWVDGQGIEPVRFEERGSAKIVISDIFKGGQGVDFSFQVAPEPVVEDVVPEHRSFGEGGLPGYLVGYEHPHYYNYLPGGFSLTMDDSSGDTDRLRVSHGDTIYVEYEDLTLPRPHFEGDRKLIVARALVLDTGAEVPGGSEMYIGVPQPGA